MAREERRENVNTVGPHGQMTIVGTTERQQQPEET